MTMLAGWSTDIKSAPHGRYVVQQRRAGVDTKVFVPERVILATKCGKVTVSHYIPDEKRWMMLAKGEQPVAWQRWPEHPHTARRETDCQAGEASQGGKDASSPDTEFDGDDILMTHEDIRA